MLFSDNQVAKYINENFEPCWQSVRAVPTVRIDFGNGSVITRTLHGNIATYACNADGEIYDILPGIYQPRVYIRQLASIKELVKFVEDPNRGDRSNPETKLVSFHKTMAESLAKNKDFAYGIPDIASPTKRMIERPSERLLLPGPFAPQAPTASAPSLLSPEEVASWRELVQDTRLNEKVRRQQIHEKLATISGAHVDDVTKWLYKNVLHADLDDPYLGLGPTLFANYPFKDERNN